MITLSNGHSFEYVASSGSLGFDGKGWFWEYPLRWVGLMDPNLFTIVLKSVTRHPRKGNLRHMWDGPKVVKLLPNAWRTRGVVNAVGLTNIGIEKWILWMKRNTKHLSGGNFIASLYSEDAGELAQMAAMIETLPLKGLEINASCPNTGCDLERNANEITEGVARVKSVSTLPIILKLSFVQDYIAIAKQVEGVVNAISVNSVPWHIVFPEKESPLKKFGGGGVSGKPAQPYMWKMVSDIALHTDIPVIGPVWDYDDMRHVRLLGAKAVSFGSVHIRYPWRPTAYVRREMRERRNRPVN